MTGSVNLIHHIRIAFTFQRILQGSARQIPSNLAQRPGSVGTHQRLGVVLQGRGQGICHRLVACTGIGIAQSHGDIAQVTTALGALDRRAFELKVELLRGQG